jgi:biotin carboxyl carrier protein
MKFNTIIENQSLEMEFSDSLNQFSIKTENDVEIDCVKLSHNSYSLILNGQSHYLTIHPHLQGYEVTVDHHTHLVHVQDEVDILLEQFGVQDDESPHAGEIHAQIPGLVSQIYVKKGDKVKVNQKLFILEAMKMENEIDSPVSGIVDHIHCKEGDKVEKGNIIMEIIS